jgi:hypothetical protein
MTTTVKLPSSKKQLTLSTDRRIKRDAIRVLRTMMPHIGKMYADGRKSTIRYKAAWPGMTVPQLEKVVKDLNAIYRANNMAASAYVHLADPRCGWRRASFCVVVPRSK